MPKKVLEMKLFNVGTITTPDSTDIPPEAASYSLDLDSIMENGKLKGVPADQSVSFTENSNNIGSGAGALNVDHTLSGNGIASVSINGVQRLVLKSSVGWKIVDG
tara:strand:- start:5033 stop:5347 length:315 start_codon:yes stop_codon:yes gene_type:complete